MHGKKSYNCENIKIEDRNRWKKVQEHLRGQKGCAFNLCYDINQTSIEWTYNIADAVAALGSSI